jgi:hypothetical protein
LNQPPPTHKLLATHLRDQFGGNASVAVFRDEQGKRPIPVGSFAKEGTCFHSTIGLFEQALPVPSGPFEMAAIGTQPWLPNCLASSLYWLKNRDIEAWPLVCEDVVKHNVRSKFRHMAYVPSSYRFEVSSGVFVRWLLGMPIEDKEISLSFTELQVRAAKMYPPWLVPSDA